MGLIRNLTADEIISQVVQGVAISREENMPPLRNVGKFLFGDIIRYTFLLIPLFFYAVFAGVVII